MAESVRIAEIPWTSYEKRLRGGDGLVLLPVGSLEQHGPHLPLNCDIAIPTAISERVAQRIDGLVAPTIAYGYKSQPKMGGGQHFPGTTSLDAMTLIYTVRDVIKEFARHGVRKMAVVVGHYENTMFTIEGIDLALRDLRADGVQDMKIVRADYWDFTSQQTIEKVWTEGFPGWATDHAGVMETSIMLHLHPELVDMEQCPMHPPAQFPPYDVYPINPAWVPADGALCSPKVATAAKGKIMIDEFTAEISKALKGEFELREGGGQSKAKRAAE
ncbi:MAG: creatininase [Dongiaceae bacterium]|jgi:creatinine amidohydrolase